MKDQFTGKFISDGKAQVGLLLANPQSYAVLGGIDLAAIASNQTGFVKAMSDVVDSVQTNECAMILMPQAIRSKIANEYAAFGKSNALIKFDDHFNMTICGVPVCASKNFPQSVSIVNSEETAAP